MMLSTLRNPILSRVFVFLFILENVLPVKSFAGGGPGSPEARDFTPHNVTQLVDPFTGDFTYNIPLMDIGGYPLNLSYRSGASMQDEASFVGLGWSLNPGAINRQVRGLPDDFKADTVAKEYHMRPDETIGFNSGANAEIFGFDVAKVGLGVQWGVNKNTYRGYGVEAGLTSSVSAGTQSGSFKFSGGLSLGVSSVDGGYLNPNVGLDFKKTYTDGSASGVGLGASMSISSREGLKEVYFNASYKRSLMRNLTDNDYENNGELSTIARADFPLSFATPTFSPTSDLPLSSTSLSLRFKLGGELYGTMVDFFASGYYSKQALLRTSETFPAYGYMYAHEADEGRVLSDFNREKDGPYQREIPNLPLTNFTYDVYAVSGQGIAGQFRPFRGDIGTLHDTFSSSEANSVNGGGEVGLGNLFHAGVDVTVNVMNEHTGIWHDNNPMYDLFPFRKEVDGSPSYEAVYFKGVGETTPMQNESLFNRTGGFDPVFVPIGNGSASNTFLKSSGEEIAWSANENYKTQREPRLLNFSFLTAQEASDVGLEPLKHYSGRSEFVDDFTGERTYELVAYPRPRTNEMRKPHHVSEITVTRDDGARYIYGLPVYAVKQKEVSFNVSQFVGNPSSALSHSATTGLVNYNPGTDNSTGNTRGLDQYFHSVETPSHANTFLLTAVLSDDYVDITDNGPTPDDFGTYTRFNYTQIHSNYRWRTPYQQNQAQFQEGYHSDPLDDRGSYVYGEKEVWYLQSIETKNYVAEFTLTDRLDGLGVLGENGGADATQRLKKLDRIDLFTQSDRIAHGPGAIPIKTVRFEYNYSLCTGTPDATSSTVGKLTLTKLSFTYGTSGKDRLSPYVFTYQANPGYQQLGMDRWGVFKPAEPVMGNERYPYTPQDGTANSNAAAWNLTEIKLPSGGIVHIDYESDDYAYVQNHRAMEMTKVLGIRNSHTGSSSFNPTVDNKLYTGSVPNSYLFFALKRPTEDPLELQEYVAGIEELYFNCALNADTPGNISEFIEGFVPVNLNQFNTDFGFYDGGRVANGYTVGWIKLPVMDMGDEDIEVTGSSGAHPMSKTAWQELRKSLPLIAYDRSLPTNFNDIAAFINEFSALGEEIDRSFNGYNPWFQNHNKGRVMELNQSFIRLNSFDKKKYGGGTRVRAITINDQWGNMVPGVPEIDNFSYGQEYFYTTTEVFGDSTRAISSGVASYEPLIGGDENPFAMPARYRVKRIMAMDVNLYMTEPFGECFFPAPQVGYSTVVIKNLSHENVTRTATGFTKYEFYTAKDFPTQVSQTELNSEESPFTPPNPFYTEEKATASQGYVIELNDMHGKLRSQKIFQEINDENPVSGIEYIYRTESDHPEKLDNRISVFNELTGEVEDKLVGVEYDFVLDAREMKKETWGPGVDINTDGFLAAIFPIIVPIPYPDMSYSVSQFRSLTATKVIQRSGLVESVIAYDLGSRVVTKNLVYDDQTGQVLITKSQNEHETDWYSTAIPAHWLYEGMGSAYQNSGITLEDLTASDGKFTVSNASKYFIRGDELQLFRKDSVEVVMADAGSGSIPAGTRYTPYFKGWVYQLGDNDFTVIDRLGSVIANGLYDMKVIRSGHRNKPALPAGNVITRTNPVEGGRLNFSEVLDATATEYQEYWQTYAGFEVPLPDIYCNCQSVITNAQYPQAYQAVYSVIQQLLISSDYKQSDVDLVGGQYNNGYFFSVFGSGQRTYYGEINGNSLEGIIRNDDGEDRITDCSIHMQMQDPSISFPDSIINVIPGTPLFSMEDFSCSDVYGLNLKIQYVKPTGGLAVADIKFTSPCFKLFTCGESVGEFPDMTCDIASGSSVNPFLLGILGNWRAKSNYAYVTNRTTGRVDSKGTFQDFDSFWNPVHFTMNPPVDRSAWQWAQKNTIIDPFGKVLEQKDPLNRYSAAIFGYGFNLPIAIAGNARYHQIAYDGFEDYEYRNVVHTPFDECPLPSHWKFEADEIDIVDTESHSGLKSVRVNGDEVISSVITPLCDPDLRTIPGENTYPIQDCDMIRKFAPIAGDYIVQGWVKESTAPADVITTYNDSWIEITTVTAGISTTQAIHPQGQIIDGWQPVQGSFSIPSNCEQILVVLHSDRTAYFDDIRLQPFSASMQTHVYNPANLRLLASLDERNYATFYEYDGEGSLVRTKKETERGILTLNEVRTAMHKQ